MRYTEYKIDKKTRETLKKCPRCNRFLPLSSFHKNKSNKSGYQCWCKECRSNWGKSRGNHPKNRPRAKYWMYKQMAKNRGHEFSLTYEQFRSLVTQACYYCGVSPNPLNGIDRVDNSKGYTIDNVVPACKYCNRMKNDLSYDEFIKQCKRILEWHTIRNALKNY